ncbi:hypothetical protein [Amycolatopsis vastitatis]|nr:hypothetical protein [Amycolatopsis vastitatis]
MQSACAPRADAARLMLATPAIIWAFLNLKHTEMATDGPQGAHIG